MLKGLLVAGLVGLVGCLGVETDQIDTAQEDAQTVDLLCRVDGTVCASILARELMGTPRLLRAYLVQRVHGNTDMWQIAHIPDPKIDAGAVYVLPFQNLAHEGTHFLVVTLAVDTCPRDCTSKLEQGGPVWTDEAIEHLTAEEIARTPRRTTSWFAAQNARRTTPMAVHRGLEMLAEPHVEMPLLSDRYDLEYQGWTGPFELDGGAIQVGLIELLPCAEVALDKMPIERP